MPSATDIRYEQLLLEKIGEQYRDKVDAMSRGLAPELYQRAVGYCEALRDVQRIAHEEVHRLLFGDDPHKPKESVR